MIFLIKNEVLEAISCYKNELENLLDSFYKGKHIVDFENSTLAEKNLNDLFSDNINIQKTIEFYKLQKQNIKSLRKKVTQYVEVHIGKYGIRCVENQKIISVDISYFDSELSPCYVLSENPYDSDFYISILYNARHFNRYHLLTNTNLSFEVDNGGGYGTHNMFERRVNEKKVVLCIVDSDKKTKTAKISGTSGKVKETLDKMEEIPKIADVHILEVREKENLIPFSLYKQYDKFSLNDTINHLEKFEGLEEEEYLRFVKLSDTSSMRYDKNCEVKDILSLTNEMKGIGKDGLRDFAVNMIYTEELAALNKIYLKKNGEIVSNDGLIDLVGSIPKYLETDYRNLVDRIYAFACSLGKVRT